jgi:hypothetical protein
MICGLQVCPYLQLIHEETLMKRYTIVAVLIAAVLLTGNGETLGAPIIYSSHGDGTRLGTIDAANASATDIGAAGYFETWAAAFDNNTGELFTIVDGFSGSNRLAKYNLTTGAATPIGTGLGTPSDTISLEIADDGTIYAASFSNQLYTVNRITGVATALPGILGPEAFGIMDMAFDPTTGILWGTGGQNLFQINPVTGTSTDVSDLTLGSSQMGLMFGDDGTMYATDYTPAGELYEVTNPLTGGMTLIGSTGFSFPHGGDILNTPVPEPSTLTLATLVLLGISYRRRKRN